jgi:hypothetical protein
MVIVVAMEKVTDVVKESVLRLNVAIMEIVLVVKFVTLALAFIAHLVN